MKGRIEALCSSDRRGPKQQVSSLEMVAHSGVQGDAHAKGGVRQVSFLEVERVATFARELGRGLFPPGAFGENILLSGMDLTALGVGRRLRCGSHAVLQLSQYGKHCHGPCEIARVNGRCVMPKGGVFARVVRGGSVMQGDEVEDTPEFNLWRIAVVTLSDKGSAGQREDLSGPAACELLGALDGGLIVETLMLPDERADIEASLIRLSDETLCDLIVTSGGTGLSPRDVTPEATMAVCDRLTPGIAEAIRHAGLAHTPRAMLSRAVAGLRNSTLIVNLSGSPRAVREQLEVLLPVLPHALAVASGVPQECARNEQT